MIAPKTFQRQVKFVELTLLSGTHAEALAGFVIEHTSTRPKRTPPSAVSTSLCRVNNRYPLRGNMYRVEAIRMSSAGIALFGDWRNEIELIGIT